MTPHDLWPALEQAPFAVAVRQNAVLFPWIESVHVLAATLVVGTVAIVDLRLLGLASRGMAVRMVSAQVLPCTWTAFGLAALTGFLLFSSDATAYAADRPFLLKMLALLIAGANMLAFQFISYRSVREWDLAANPPLAARSAAAVSLACWIAVVVCGRWIGFSLN